MCTLNDASFVTFFAAASILRNVKNFSLADVIVVIVTAFTFGKVTALKPFDAVDVTVPIFGDTTLMPLTSVVSPTVTTLSTTDDDVWLTTSAASDVHNL